ncbi:hypothetical protein [Halolamina salina]|uniref:Uncharacterized protein n=1 Tax=Halolamina salina TaxID=1220023 RepID=A0ABD6B6W4_9EURY
MLGGLARPDYHLLFIPSALLCGIVAAVLSPLSLGAGAGVGSLLASAAVVDGLALNPPTEN